MINPDSYTGEVGLIFGTLNQRISRTSWTTRDGIAIYQSLVHFTYFLNHGADEAGSGILVVFFSACALSYQDALWEPCAAADRGHYVHGRQV